MRQLGLQDQTEKRRQQTKIGEVLTAAGQVFIVWNIGFPASQVAQTANRKRINVTIHPSV